MPSHGMLLLLAAVLVAPVAVAQPTPIAVAQTAPSTGDAELPAKPIEFDVASFRLNKSRIAPTDFEIPAGGDGITILNLPIIDLISNAFVRGPGGRYRISGQPSWVNDDRYDIQAKVAPEDLAKWQNLTPGDQRIAMQGFVIEYLKLKYHQDTASHPYYALIVGKNGPKMKEYAPGPEGLPASAARVCHMMPGNEADGVACPMRFLAALLSSHSDRPIVDKTGLTATYSFTLHFDSSPDYMPNHATDLVFLPPEVAARSIASAVKQIGLELVPKEGPLGGIVIDHIERPPEP